MELNKQQINLEIREKTGEILDYLETLHHEGYLTTTELGQYWDIFRNAQNAVLDLDKMAFLTDHFKIVTVK